MNPSDPLQLARALIQCPSVTPEDAGAQQIVADALATLGFTIQRLTCGRVQNLIARAGTGAPHFAFAGHTDVVPPGKAWQHDPFAGTIQDGLLFGRGAVDMKGAIAAFIAALDRRRNRHGSISVLITGDEEGPAIDGTARILARLAETRSMPDMCLVGEPTCRALLGDTIKIGRRGSISARIAVRGTQGHVAYPHLADNPLHRLIPALEQLRETILDDGNEWFEPSSLQVTSIDVGNSAGNVIPAEATAALNIRFNNTHTGAALGTWITETLHRYAPDAQCDITIGGEAFLTEPSILTQALTSTIERATGMTPKHDTGGGTSDARMIARHCTVAEFGLVGRTMHRTDEAVPVTALYDLAAIYAGLLDTVLA